MVDTEKLTTLRRRITDKLCKSNDFLNSVAGLAIEEGAIKHTDILNRADINTLLGVPPKQK